jgi:DNA-binding NarL/FixJ family response regulator
LPQHTVLIVDDEPGLRRMLRRHLERDPRFSHIVEAASITEAVQVAALTQPNVIVLDQMLPDGHGIDAIPLLLEVSPSARVLVYSAVTDETLRRQAFGAGAYACLAKDDPMISLLDVAAPL